MAKENSNVNHMIQCATMMAKLTRWGTSGRRSTWVLSAPAHALEDSRAGDARTAADQVARSMLVCCSLLDMETPYAISIAPLSASDPTCWQTHTLLGSKGSFFCFAPSPSNRCTVSPFRSHAVCDWTNCLITFWQMFSQRCYTALLPDPPLKPVFSLLTVESPNPCSIEKQIFLPFSFWSDISLHIRVCTSM